MACPRFSIFAVARGIAENLATTSGELQRSRSSVCVSPMPIGRPRLRRTSYHRMSSEWRDESRGTDGSNPFSSTDESYKPDHSDRSGAERRAARETEECQWTVGNANTITCRESSSVHPPARRHPADALRRARPAQPQRAAGGALLPCRVARRVRPLSPLLTRSWLDGQPLNLGLQAFGVK